MRIDLNAGLPLEHPSSSKAQNSRLVSRDNGEAAAAAVSNVSEKSSVHELASIALNAPEIRMRKVEALRASISAGQYRVRAGEIAASLLEELRTR
jgi:flagellar biosynthesis anti-sigma factor FlgM